MNMRNLVIKNTRSTRVQVPRLKSILPQPKRSQQTMSMPFGLIFSIFLIVIFIVIAFIAVRHFLSIGDCSGVGLFYSDTKDSDGLQYNINLAFTSDFYEDIYKINLPSGITRVCFANLSATINNQEDYEQIKNYDVYEANLFLIPPEETCNMPYKLIKHLNITKITELRNPYCVDVSRDLKIKKDPYVYGRDVIVE